MRYLLLSLLALYTSMIGWAYAADQSFGTIEYINGAGALNATMSPVDGSITCNNNSDYNCPSFGTPGSFTISGTPGTDVDIRCRKSPEISNGNTVLRIRNTQIHIDGATAACNGKSRSILVHTLTGNQARDTVYIGARLRIRNGESSDLNGPFTASQAGGQNHSIRYIFI